MTLTAIPTENLLKEKHQHKGTTKTIANPLRNISWSEYSYPTGVVNLIYEPNYICILLPQQQEPLEEAKS